MKVFLQRNILLNYATYNHEVGYNQGMSDLLASVLAIVQDEVDAFWCFVGLIEGSVFVTPPKDDVMDKQLVSKESFTLLLIIKIIIRMTLEQKYYYYYYCLFSNYYLGKNYVSLS